VKRNNNLGTPQPTPMPRNYKGSSKQFAMLRQIDGHVPLTDEDTDGDAPMHMYDERNCTYPNSDEHEYPLKPEDSYYTESTY
jgi:hypothetical protein